MLGIGLASRGGGRLKLGEEMFGECRAPYRRLAYDIKSRDLKMCVGHLSYRIIRFRTSNVQSRTALTMHIFALACRHTCHPESSFKRHCDGGCVHS